jgi:hypothetical protein
MPARLSCGGPFSVKGPVHDLMRFPFSISYCMDKTIQQIQQRYTNHVCLMT